MWRIITMSSFKLPALPFHRRAISRCLKVAERISTGLTFHVISLRERNDPFTFQRDVEHEIRIKAARNRRVA